MACGGLSAWNLDPLLRRMAAFYTKKFPQKILDTVEK